MTRHDRIHLSPNFDNNRVLFVISDLGPGGAQRVATTVAMQLSARGYDVSLITLAGEDTDFFTLPDAIKRITLGGIGNSRSLGAAIAANMGRISRLRNAIRKSGAKTVVSFVASTNILTILASAGLGVRVVISERNDPARQSLGPIWDILRKKIYRFADVVSANSEGALASMSAYVPARKLALVCNPLARPRLEIAANMTESAVFQSPTVLSVGRLSRQKGYDVLLRAFAQLTDRVEWRLAIAGDGELKDELARLADGLGIAARTDWIGQVKDPFVLYRQAHFLVMASRFEGVPNVLLEAMSCGLPVIVTDGSPGPLEYVKDQFNGYIIGVDDVDALAAAMEKMMASPDLRCSLGTAAKNSLSTSDTEVAMATWIKALALSPRSANCTVD